MNRRNFLKSLIFAGGATLAGGSAYALHSVDLEISRQQVPLKRGDGDGVDLLRKFGFLIK